MVGSISQNRRHAERALAVLGRVCSSTAAAQGPQSTSSDAARRNSPSSPWHLAVHSPLPALPRSKGSPLGTSSSEQASITVTTYLEGPTKARRRLSPLTTKAFGPLAASRATTLPDGHSKRDSEERSKAQAAASSLCDGAADQELQLLLPPN